MKILYDNHVYNWQKVGGISKYYTELISHLKNYDVKVLLPVFLSNNYYLRDNESFMSVYRFLPAWDNVYRNKIIGRVNNMVLDYYYLKNDFDIYHPTYYDLSFLSRLKNKPFVLTVHDMYNERFNIDSGNIIAVKKELIKRADRIIAISENTKNDILEFCEIEENRISVIYHGVRSVRVFVQPRGFHMKPYILFVGGRKDYKNFNRLIEAFSIISKKNPDLNLVCVGSSFSKDELVSFYEFNIADKVCSLSADDNELAWLDKNAIFFIFPSLYEGFGLPLLEAFQYGAPSAVSDASCFPEIALDAVVYFNPYDVESIAFAMESLLLSETLREQLTKKGYKLLEKYSWNKTAFKTKEVYESML